MQKSEAHAYAIIQAKPEFYVVINLDVFTRER